MADKRIVDFPTAESAEDEDLLLIASGEDTYNIQVKLLKDAVEGDANRAAQAALAAQQAVQAVEDAAEELAESASESIRTAQQAADLATDTIEEGQELIDELRDLDVTELMEEVNIHLADLSNPHNVTPAQIGAATQAQAIWSGVSTSQDMDFTKTATVDEGFALKPGVTVRIRFSYEQSYKWDDDEDNPNGFLYLNVNNTGTIPVAYRVTPYGVRYSTDMYGAWYQYDVCDFCLVNRADDDMSNVGSTGTWVLLNRRPATINNEGYGLVRLARAKNNLVTAIANGQEATVPRATLMKTYLDKIDNYSVDVLNRSTVVNAADANYTEYMARGEGLFSAETTPTVNGTIAWTYE